MKKYLLVLLVALMAASGTLQAQSSYSVSFYRTGKTYGVNNLASSNGVIYKALISTVNAPPHADWVNISSTAGSGSGNINDGTVVGNMTFWNGTSWVETAAVTTDDTDIFILNDLVVTGSISGSNLSGTNTGDQTSITDFTGTKSEFNISVTDGDILYVGDVTEADPIFVAEESDILKTNEAKVVTSQITFSSTGIPLINALTSEIDAAGILAVPNSRWVLDQISTGAVDSLALEYTHKTTTKGVITKDGKRFIHDYTNSPTYGTNDFARNLFIGLDAGNFTINDADEVGIKGIINTSVGNSTLMSLTTGSWNNMLGSEAGLSITTGNGNSGFGDTVLYYLTTGNENLAMGKNSLQNLIDGNYNIAMGRNTGFGLTGGSDNIFIGGSAGRFYDGSNPLLTSNGSIFIGSQTKSSADVSINEIVIGRNAIGNGNNTATLGNATITDTYLEGEVHASAFEIPLTIDADNGVINYNGGSFLHSYSGNTTYSSQQYWANLFIGQDAGNFTSTGSGAGLDSSLGNIGLGSNTLMGLTTGSWNIAIGTENLALLTTGYNNVAIGSGGAMYYATTGGRNVAIGAASMQNVVGGSRNTGVGMNSLQNIVNSDGNTAIGDNSGYFLNGGGNITSATNSLFIGRETKSLADAQDNEIVIGYLALGKGSNTAIIGNSSITDTYLGGEAHFDGFTLSAMQTAPSSATDTGTLGEVRITATHIYVCTATDTWKRISLSTW